MNIALDGLLKGYDTIWRRLSGSSAVAPKPLVRCNVMLPVRHPFRRKYLRIFYKSFPDGTSYTAARWGAGITADDMITMQWTRLYLVTLDSLR